MTEQPRHVPVMLTEIVDYLAPALQDEGAVYVDGTLGMGGHTEAILQACPRAKAIGIDRDPAALDLAQRRLAPFGPRFVRVRAVYDEVADAVRRHSPQGTAQAILFDLGVSSLQLDEEERGFAYRVDAPLDMRMDPTSGPTAADVLATASVDHLTFILREYGEERFARRIATRIDAARQKAPLTRSGQLVDLLRTVIPAASQRSGGHPAKRTFQALRIEVNGELRAWERALPAAISTLSVRGRVAVLSYHSLEDRMTKKQFVTGATSTTPAGLPVELEDHAPYLKILTSGAQLPTPEEIDGNPRAASAKLRVAERIREGGGREPRALDLTPPARRSGRGRKPDVMTNRQSSRRGEEGR